MVSLLLLLAACATAPEERVYRMNANTTVHINAFGVVYLEQTVPDRWGNPTTVRYIVDKR